MIIVVVVFVVTLKNLCLSRSLLGGMQNAGKSCRMPCMTDKLVASSLAAGNKS